MKCICTQQNLLRGILIAEKIIARNATLPILQNILLTSEQKGSNIKLASTDLEIGVEITIPAKIEEEGSIAVPGRILSGLLRNLPGEKVEISEKSSSMSIRCANYTSNIKGESANDFPLIPAGSGKEELPIRSAELLAGISSVLYSCSALDIKPEISGVYLSVKNDGICFAATDSFRLAEKRIPYALRESRPRTAILPRKTCDAILKIFEGFDYPLMLEIQDNQIIMKNIPEDPITPSVRLVSRLIDGEYPQYEQIIPTSFLTEAEISRDEFIQHIKNASLFSNKINEIAVRLDEAKQRIEISSQDSVSGDFSSFIPCTIRGKERKLVFNFQYVLDGIQHMKSSHIFMKCNEEMTPALFMPSDADGFRYVVMPIKM